MLEPHDDAQIAFRYVENIVAGRGFSYNGTEPVEGYSSPLFVLLLVGLRVCGLSPEAGATLLTLIALALLVAGVHRWIGHVADDVPNLARWGIALCPLLHPGTWYYALSGLETTAFSAAVCWFFVLLSARSHASRGGSLAWLVLASIGVVWLRPEGPMYVAAGVVALVLIRKKLDRAIVVLAAGAALAFGALLLYRLTLFEMLVPNTAVAKLDGPTARGLYRGSVYASEGAVWLLPALGSACLLRLREAERLLLLVAALVPCAVAVLVGGDWMAGQRFLLPAVAPCCVALGVLAARSFRQWLFPLFDKRRIELGPLLGGAAMVLIGLVGVTLAQWSQLRYLQDEQRSLRAWREVGEQFAQSDGTGCELAAGAIGSLGYHSEWSVIDAFGLTDKEIAREGEWVASATSGHQRQDPAAVWERRPDVVFVTSRVMASQLSEHDVSWALAGDPNQHWISELRRQPGFDAAYSLRSLSTQEGFLPVFVRQGGFACAPSTAETSAAAGLEKD